MSLEEARRRLRQAAHRDADLQNDKLAELQAAVFIRAKVTAVIPAGAADGVNALVKVSYRGGQVPVADYPDSYTPALGHSVLCVLTADNQLSILSRGIGQP